MKTYNAYFTDSIEKDERVLVFNKTNHLVIERDPDSNLVYIGQRHQDMLRVMCAFINEDWVDYRILRHLINVKNDDKYRNMPLYLNDRINKLEEPREMFWVYSNRQGKILMSEEDFKSAFPEPDEGVMTNEVEEKLKEIVVKAHTPETAEVKEESNEETKSDSADQSN